MSRRRWMKGSINLSFSWFYQLQPSKLVLCAQVLIQICVSSCNLCWELYWKTCVRSLLHKLWRMQTQLSLHRALLMLQPGCQHRGATLNIRDRFSSLPEPTSSMWCLFFTSGVEEEREGFLRMKWIIAGKAVKPPANTGANDKEKGVPDSVRLGESSQVTTAVFCLSPNIWSSGCCFRQSFKQTNPQCLRRGWIQVWLQVTPLDQSETIHGELCDRNGITWQLNTKGNAEQMNSWNEKFQKGLNQKQD